MADGAGQWLTEGEFWAKHERRFLAGLGGDLLRGDYIDPPRRARFEAWAKAWWDTTSRLRPSSRCSHRARLDRHILPFFSRRKVGSIDYASLELWLSDRRKAGLGRCKSARVSPAKRTRANAETRLGLTHTGHA